MKRLLASTWVRIGLVLAMSVAVVLVLVFHGPSWNAFRDAFTAVIWEWVAVAIGLNLLSVVARSVAWRIVIDQALPPPHPSYRSVFSAFSVGLFANAVLPGRIGELARVAVLNRKLPRRSGAWAALVGTVFAHRVFDLVPVLLLIVYVVLTARVPQWAVSSLAVVVIAGIALLAFAMASAKHRNRSALEELGAVRRVVAMARQGLGVMRSPVGAATAILFQVLGWTCQILAVWTAMFAFDIHKSLPAAGLVLVLMNVATVFPLWPGNVGLVQGAIALGLLQYGVSYATGFAYGVGLQAIEASVGVGVGLVFLAREGLSFAMLRVMPDASQAEVVEESDEGAGSADESQGSLVGDRSG